MLVLGSVLLCFLALLVWVHPWLYGLTSIRRHYLEVVYAQVNVRLPWGGGGIRQK